MKPQFLAVLAGRKFLRTLAKVDEDQNIRLGIVRRRSFDFAQVFGALESIRPISAHLSRDETIKII